MEKNQRKAPTIIIIQNNLGAKERIAINRMAEQLSISFVNRLRNKIFFYRKYFFRYYLLYQGKELIGFACVYSNFIFSLCIHKRFQHKGFGSKLLRFVINDLSKRYSLIYLKCEQEGLKKFYKKFGFKEFGSYMILKF